MPIFSKSINLGMLLGQVAKISHQGMLLGQVAPIVHQGALPRYDTQIDHLGHSHAIWLKAASHQGKLTNYVS